MMERQLKEDSFPPQCLNLRVHSSILLGNSAENEILLPKGIVFRTTEGTKFGGDDINTQDGHIFTTEESADMNHVYVSVDNQIPTHGYDAKKQVDGKTCSGRFDILTSARERILVQQSIDGIDELGRRARARTKQQRLNRKGIKVIEGAPLIAEQEQKESKLTAISSKTNTSTKRPRVRNRNEIQQSSSTKISRRSNQSLWSPDVSRIPIPPKGNQSTYVQLHGLPRGSTFETVRRFFTGLVPQRILVVLSNRVHISELDATSYGDLSLFGLKGIVYTNRDVRVLVKFGSVPEAGLAADRSGETIASKHINIPKSVRRTDVHHQDAFTIGVTKISKELALSLSKLSFDATPGVPFHDCLSDVESKLHSKVREILWTSTKKACQISLEDEIKNANLLIDVDDLKDKDANETKALIFADYKKHSIHHNYLLRIHDHLMISVENDKSDIGASIPFDAVAQLTANACKVIDLELDRVDCLLHQYRISRLFQ